MVNGTNNLGNGQSNVTFIWLDHASITSYTIWSYQVGVSTNLWTTVAAGIKPAGVAGLWRNYTVTVTNGIEYEFQYGHCSSLACSLQISNEIE
jgi:hypothetical protein